MRKETRLTGLCRRSVDRSLCGFVGSALLPSLFNSLPNGNSGLLKKIVHADIALRVSYKKRWTAEFIEAFEGLRASNRYAKCVKAAIPLPLQDFVVDLRERLHALWRELDSLDPRTHSQTGYLSCMDGPASQANFYKGPFPFAPY